MSGQNTELYAGIVVALMIGAAVGYFVYPAMNRPAPESAPEPQPQVRDHNHLGLWAVTLVTLILGTITVRAVFEHVGGK